VLYFYSKVPILPVSAGAQFYLICILKRISRSYVVGAGTIYSCIRIMYGRTKFSNTMVTTSRFVGLNWFHGVHSCRSWIFLSSSFYFPPPWFSHQPTGCFLPVLELRSFFFWFSHHPKGCFLPDYQRVPKLKRNKKVRKRTEKRQKKGTGKVTTRALQPKGCFLPDCQKVPKLKRSQKVTKKEPGKKYRKKETHKSTCRSHTISSTAVLVS